MAWEKRGTRKYYYRSVRRNGRVVKEYFGKGFAASMAAKLDAATQSRRAASRLALKRIKCEIAQVEALFSNAAKTTKLLTEAILIAAGYYRHGFEWRLRRKMKPSKSPQQVAWQYKDIKGVEQMPETPEKLAKTQHFETEQVVSTDESQADPLLDVVHFADTTEDQVQDQVSDITEGEDEGHLSVSDEGSTDGDSTTTFDFRALVELANSGDEEAISFLRVVLDSNPEIWQRTGDLNAQSEFAIIRSIAKNNQLVIESLQRKLKQMKAELGGESDGVMNQLMVDHVTACWLQMQYVDAQFASTSDPSLIKLWGEQQDRAHRRFTAALKQLSTLRNLAP